MNVFADKSCLGIEFGSTRIKAVAIDEKHIPVSSGDYTWKSTYENGTTRNNGYAYQFDFIFYSYYHNITTRFRKQSFAFRWYIYQLFYRYSF